MEYRRRPINRKSVLQYFRTEVVVAVTAVDLNLNTSMAIFSPYELANPRAGRYFDEKELLLPLDKSTGPRAMAGLWELWRIYDWL
jgi:hypothetical protein